VETSAILLKVNIKQEIRDHRYFAPMWDAAGDCLTYQNDILSIKKEIDNGDPFNNLIHIKVKQGASGKEAFKETLRCIWDSTYQFMYFAELLLGEYPDDSDLALYIEMIIDMINGDPSVHGRMERYHSASCEIVPLGEEFDSLDEQYEYAYNTLLKQK